MYHYDREARWHVRRGFGRNTTMSQTEDGDNDQSNVLQRTYVAVNHAHGWAKRPMKDEAVRASLARTAYRDEGEDVEVQVFEVAGFDGVGMTGAVHAHPEGEVEHLYTQVLDGDKVDEIIEAMTELEILHEEAVKERIEPEE